MGIISYLAKKKEQRATEETRDKIISQLQEAGASEDTLAVMSTIRAENSEKLLAAMKNVQDIVGATKTAEQSTVASRAIALSQQPGGIEALQQQNLGGAKFTQGGVSIDVPSQILERQKADLEVETTGRKAKVTKLAEVESKQAEEVLKAENVSQGTFRFMQQFGKSIDELRKFDPEFDKVGASGWLSRKQALIAEKLDILPETKAMKIQAQPIANGMAREIEGGRVTDADRKIYAKSLADGISNPNVTNVRLMSNSLIGLLDKGGNENGKITNQLKMLAKSDHDIFKGVISQVLVEYPELVKDIYGEGFEVEE